MAKFSGHIYYNATFAKSVYVGKIIYGLLAKQVACPRYGWYERSSG